MIRDLGGFDPKATYSAAAEEYEAASQRYWQFLSIRTVDRLDLRPGQSVLDVACGTAPATIAAARRVSPGGRVIGVDYADGMLAVARRNVGASGLSGIELVQGDMRALPYGADFDAVVCVLGIFFLSDMAGAARALWKHVKPGGTLAVTTFGTEVWEPALAYFIEAAGRARPNIERVLPWRRTESPIVLERIFGDAGIPGVRVAQQIDDIRLPVQDWKSIVMGSGLRRIAVDLGDQFPTVLSETEEWLRNRRLDSVRVSSNYAMAVKAT